MAIDPNWTHLRKECAAWRERYQKAHNNLGETILREMARVNDLKAIAAERDSLRADLVRANNEALAMKDRAFAAEDQRDRLIAALQYLVGVATACEGCISLLDSSEVQAVLPLLADAPPQAAGCQHPVKYRHGGEAWTCGTCGQTVQAAGGDQPKEDDHG